MSRTSWRRSPATESTFTWRVLEHGGPELIATSPLEFSIEKSPVKFVFVREADGKVSSVKRIVENDVTDSDENLRQPDAERVSPV